MTDPHVAGPRTIAAKALLTRAPGDKSTMRGVAIAELTKLLARIEDEATAPYRAELEWALDQLGGNPAVDPARLAQARELLDRG